MGSRLRQPLRLPVPDRETRFALAGLSIRVLERAAVELARDWRTDKALRHLEALLITADQRTTLLVSGTGEVLSPDDNVVAVGSGGSYALAAARALLKYTELSAEEVVRESLAIAADIDIYTNDQITVEELRA